MKTVVQRPHLVINPTDTPSRKGARVYGNPMCDDVFNYIDSVSIDSDRQRMISMFFVEYTDLSSGINKESDF